MMKTQVFVELSSSSPDLRGDMNAKREESDDYIYAMDGKFCLMVWYTKSLWYD